MAGRTRRTARAAVGVTLSAAVLAAALPAGAQAAATRTWVSGVGDDINPCSRTLPCKTLDGAISKTEPGGEINALDPGGYGIVVVTKAITIDLSTANRGGILLTGMTHGVIVAAGADDDVILRGLNIAGGAASATCSGVNGLNGIWIRSARSVRIEDVATRRTTRAGVRIAPETTDVSVLVNRVDVGDSCEQGITVEPADGRTADVTVRNSTIASTGTGLRTAPGAHVWLSGTTVFGNGIGIDTSAGGIVDSWWGTNQIQGNDVDGTPTNVLGAPPAPPAPAPVPPAPAPPASAPPAAAPAPAPPVARPTETKRCTVPKVTRLTLSAAGAKLRKAGCAPGRVTRQRTTRRALVGRVLSQQQKAGTSVALGTKVNVTIGRR